MSGQPRDDNGQFQSNHNNDMSNNNAKQNQQNASTVDRVRNAAKNNLDDITPGMIRGLATVSSLAYLFVLFGAMALPLNESVMAVVFVTLAGAHAYTRVPGDRLDTEVAAYVAVGCVLGLKQLGAITFPVTPMEVGSVLLLIVTAGGYVLRGNRHDRRDAAAGGE